ncbi:MAG: DUF4152 family protein [Candidatus Bathyarchaeota archaeon]|nr:DUF4152 family protein [Candidatus Bathyarchaeota archaeon]
MGEKINLRIVAADSGAAILNDKFEPVTMVAACAVVTKPPYKQPESCLAEPIFVKANSGYNLIVRELELCQLLLKDTKADVVHLDLSLNGVNVENLSAVDVSYLKRSPKVRGQILKIVPKLRKTATNILRTYELQVLALGKESMPVRIAELTSGAHAVGYIAQKVITENVKIRVGLPTKCQAELLEDKILVHSLIPTENGVCGIAHCSKDVIKNVKLEQFSNPCARGFKVLEIMPLTTS